MDTQQTEVVDEQAAAPDTGAQPGATPLDAATLRREAFLQCERTLNGHPPQSMRAELLALAESVGPDEQPDRYGGGALIEAFEREIAELLGKEAAVFMPSGTMAQQIALRIWSERSGRTTVAFHPTCHLEIHENKGYERLHALHATLVGDAERVITLGDLRATPEPLAALLLELPQREIGGQLPEWEALAEQTAWARSRGAAAHMDGARLWEAAAYYERSYAEIASLFDSIYVSFYKGVGAITGAALAGPAEFVAEARIWQRRHGGNLLHLWPYVLSARAALHARLPRFASYHAKAVEIAAALAQVDGVILKPNPPQTHMAHVYLRGDTERLLDASAELAREQRLALFTWLQPAPIPGYAMFEMNIGDGALELSSEEVAGYFERVLRSAR